MSLNWRSSNYRRTLHHLRWKDLQLEQQNKYLNQQHQSFHPPWWGSLWVCRRECSDCCRCRFYQRLWIRLTKWKRSKTGLTSVKWSKTPDLWDAFLKGWLDGDWRTAWLAPPIKAGKLWINTCKWKCERLAYQSDVVLCFTGYHELLITNFVDHVEDLFFWWIKANWSH